VENSALSQHRTSVVVDFFPSQTVISVEGIHTAKWELDSAPGRRKATPPAEVRAANGDFNHNVVCDLSSLYLDLQIGKGLHELLVEQADSLAACIVFAPRLVIVPRVVTEGSENTFKVMLVLKSNVLLNNGDTSRPFVFRNRCAGHSHLQSRLDLGACNP
jgi:hypothetical protein